MVYLDNTTDLQLERISQWFSNKLSLSLSKTKCLFFHETSKREEISLLLLKLKTNNCEIE